MPKQVRYGFDVNTGFQPADRNRVPQRVYTHTLDAGGQRNYGHRRPAITGPVRPVSMVLCHVPTESA